MRRVLGYFILTAATVSSISLASCGNDDDDDDPVTPVVTDTTNKVPTDTTNNVPADTTNNVPTDTTTNNDPSKDQNTPQNTTEYTLSDLQGIWHLKLSSGHEEYLEIDGDITNVMRYNTEYMGEDKWILLKLSGNNVTNNVLGFSQKYLTNTYGYAIKSVSATEFVATPNSMNQYYDLVDKVTFTKVSELPARFKEDHFFQFSMDYTE